ncbi:GNAT family N-acetyltransferase [Brevibacillus ruminantium]|uniref:GNAT family N-acetyltransferase n=1 Tax=Brevibacillus ruminantium TaxID=2950604 RepID=A0ABY4W7Z7_9BACL|nr:GNAT family N-acetyltransferase [Brevibacillus ruminantium]USG63297.1 GNAT family N-acetyltransferase [Brevibacillus ruminantium]
MNRKTIGNEKEYVVEFTYITGQEAREIEVVKELFLEYAQSLEIDLSFQDFDTEFQALPGKYGSPDGALLLAFVDGQAAGCIALRKIEEGICEMKRLFVRDGYRGFHIGKSLIQMIMQKASQMDYNYMRLDTLPTMTKAQDLYRSFGFYEIEPYVFNPVEGTRFMEVNLKSV